MRARGILFVAGALPLSASAADFRSADFGMSVEQVKATEPNIEWLDDGTNERIGFETSINGLAAVAVYEFDDGRFTAAMYDIVQEHTNNTLFVNDFRGLAELLEEKYGAPSEDQTLWRDDLYRDQPSDWGTAVAVGHLVMFKSWVTERVEINLYLAGDNFAIDLQILYADPRSAEQRANESRQETLDAL